MMDFLALLKEGDWSDDSVGTPTVSTVLKTFMLLFREGQCVHGNGSWIEIQVSLSSNPSEVIIFPRGNPLFQRLGSGSIASGEKTKSANDPNLEPISGLIRKLAVKCLVCAERT